MPETGSAAYRHLHCEAGRGFDLSETAVNRGVRSDAPIPPSMKLVTFSLLFVSALAAPIAGRAEDTVTVAPAPQPAPAGVMIADLRGEATPAYGYESWTDRMNRTADGVAIVGSKGAQGDGGFCGSLSTPLDLTGMTYIDVALAVGPANEVPEVTVALDDADGTMASARIRIDQIVPGQPVWFRVPVATLHLGSGKYAGTVGGFDVTRVTQWHLQGDWATKKPLNVLFIAVRARR